MLDFSLSLPPGITDAGARELGKDLGKEAGAVATGNLLRIVEGRTATSLVVILGAWLAFKVYQGLRERAVRHDIVHRGETPPPPPPAKA